VRVTLLLEENDLWDIFKNIGTPPIDPSELVAHKKREMKAKRMMLDSTKDHMIPHESNNKTTKEVFDAVIILYQNHNINKKMVLQNKLISIAMTRSDTIISYLMKITHIRDRLALLGEKVEDVELVKMALNGFAY
jgi:hypothetical protein